MGKTAEPRITISGVLCSDAQAGTIRVALESFDGYLEQNGLGEDPTGKAITSAYRARIRELRTLIFRED